MIKKYLFIISVIIIGSLLIAQDDFGDFGDEQNASEGVAAQGGGAGEKEEGRGVNWGWLVLVVMLCAVVDKYPRVLHY